MELKIPYLYELKKFLPYFPENLGIAIGGFPCKMEIQEGMKNSLRNTNLMIAKSIRFFANRHNLMGLRRFVKNPHRHSEREFVSE